MFKSLRNENLSYCNSADEHQHQSKNTSKIFGFVKIQFKLQVLKQNLMEYVLNSTEYLWCVCTMQYDIIESHFIKYIDKIQMEIIEKYIFMRLDETLLDRRTYI